MGFACKFSGEDVVVRALFGTKNPGITVLRLTFCATASGVKTNNRQDKNKYFFITTSF